jgi:uncharacterized membrane protein YkvA (DUF1232 family)
MSLVERWLGRVRHKMALVWGIATDRRLPWRARAPAVLALAYVASPIDLIPDSLPGFGWLDDFLVVLIAAAITPLLVPRRLRLEHGGRAAAPAGRAEPLASGTGLVALSWLLIIIGSMLALAALFAAFGELGTGA